MTQKRIPLGLGLAVAALIAVTLVPGTAVINAQQLPAPGQTLSAGQLDDLVAPIALYPDPLISQILVAATYPLEIIEASQWLQRNPNLNGTALTQAVDQQNWDPSVQALVPFPDVLKYLTEDVVWTTNLGNAFLAQEADVMDAIQRMRAKAAESGKLSSSPQQQVTQTYDSGQTVYEILPTDPDIIYVPVYDPYWIWGDPFYYPYARWYYPQRTSALYFSRGVSLQLFFGSGWHGTGWQGWNSWGWRPAWSSHNVIVNNTFIQHQNFNTTRLSNLTGTSRWSHDVTHRQGVPYPTTALADRYRAGTRGNVRTPDSPRQSTVPSPSNSAVSRLPSRGTSGWRGDDGNSTTGSVRRNPTPNSAVTPRAVTPAPNSARTWSPPTNREIRPERGARSDVPRPVSPATRVPPTVERAPARRPTPSAPPVVRQPAPVHAAPQARTAPAPRPTPAPAHQPAPRSSGGGDDSRGKR